MSLEQYDQTFEKVNFSVEVLAHTYESCSFKNCRFEEVDLSKVVFIDCSFENCHLSNANILKSAFRNVQFKDCKMLGLRFDQADAFLFEIEATGCMLNLASFYKMKLAKTKFKDCALREVDFVGCDLSNASFMNCDLLGANFEQAILKKADLRSAYNFSIDPEQTQLAQAQFSKESLAGLLSKYNLKIE